MYWTGREVEWEWSLSDLKRVKNLIGNEGEWRTGSVADKGVNSYEKIPVGSESLGRVKSGRADEEQEVQHPTKSAVKEDHRKSLIGSGQINGSNLKLKGHSSSSRTWIGPSK